MSEKTESRIGRGIYTIAEAARLVERPADRLRRWVRGYSDRGRWVPPLLGFGDTVADAQSISFADLMEILHLDHFVQKGVSLRMVRTVSEAACAELGTRYPFSTHRFRTDGKSILKELHVDKKHPSMYNILTGQIESTKLLKSLLKGELDLNARDVAERWWPLKRSHDVVLDPQRRFGAPISSSSGIPTYILANAFKAERKYEVVANWYGVERRAVMHAVAFERAYA